MSLRTAISVDVAPADAILRRARLGRHSLIIMGVRQQTGDRLPFGDVADFVLESSDRSILFLASED